MFRASLFTVLLSASTVSVFAQTSPKPDGLWRGALGAGATVTSGNNDSVTYTLNADAVKQTQEDKLSGYLQAIYGRRKADDGATQRTANLLRGGSIYNRNLNERSFGFGLFDVERNTLIDLNLRGVVAGGLGYHVVKREGLTFDVSSGPAYNREKYTNETRDAFEWLVAEESTHALSPTVSFRQRFAYYANLKDAGEYRFALDAGLVFKINSRWNATMTVNDRYQSNPRTGVKNNDLLFVTGVQYVFNP